MPESNGQPPETVEDILHEEIRIRERQAFAADMEAEELAAKAQQLAAHAQELRAQAERRRQVLAH